MPVKEAEYLIVGGGAVGLSVAYELAKKGAKVLLLEAQEVGSGAMGASAGMLSPAYEVEFQEIELLQALKESRNLYESWRKELPDIGYQETGTLEVPLTREDLPYIRRRYEFEKSLGLSVEWIEGQALRDLVPRLSPKIPAGSFAPNDHQVDPLLLIQALKKAIADCGGRILEYTPVFQYGQNENYAWAQSTDNTFVAHKILIAVGVAKNLSLPFRVYAVRGQMLSLQLPHPGWIPCPVRYFNRIYGYGYCVPKKDRIIVGSTAEEKGPHAHLTAGGLLDILRRAHLAFPDIEELPVMHMWAGLRPATQSRYPILYQEGHIYYVNGLYRNGILMAPLVGVGVSQWLQGQTLPPSLMPFWLKDASNVS